MSTDISTAGIYKDLLQKAGEIAKAQKKINQSLDEELSKQIPEAIKNNDEEIISLKLRLLRDVIHEIEDTLRLSEIVVRDIQDVESDKPFSEAHHNDLEKLTKAISDARTKLTAQLAAAKKLETDAKKGFDKAFNSQEEAFREIARFELDSTNYRKQLQATQGKANVISDKAAAAVEARDSKALAEDQKAMRALGIEGTVAEYRSDDRDSGLKDFLRRIEKDGFAPDVLAQLKDEANKLLKFSDANKNIIDDLEEANKKVLGYEIAEIDVKKAAKTLKIDPKIQSKVEPALAKALNGPAKDYEKGLDAVAHQFQLKTTGKQMLADLKKAGVV